MANDAAPFADVRDFGTLVGFWRPPRPDTEIDY
jgi:hypothetical protein